MRALQHLLAATQLAQVEKEKAQAAALGALKCPLFFLYHYL